MTPELKELLELAAKAAGVKGAWGREAYIEGHEGFIPTGAAAAWKPHESDGESRRLQVALDIPVELGGRRKCVYATVDDSLSPNGRITFAECFEHHQGDKPAAYRMAVLRAAAEMGRKAP